MSSAARGPEIISDPATRVALERLAESRLRLAGWATQMSDRKQESASGFQPRSATLRLLMGLGLPKLIGFALPRSPWLRWGISAFMMLRSMRKK